MAETVVVGHQTYKKRHPFAVWLVWPILTLGIYSLVWWYKINNEARRYLQDDSIRPGVSLLAVLVGWIVIVPPFVSVYRTGGRIARMEEAAGLGSRVEPVVGLLLSFVFSLHELYYQSHLNSIWDAYLRQRQP